MEKLFNKKATIITSNNDKYLLERSRFFIMPRKGRKRIRHKFGNVCTINRLDEDNNKLEVKDVSIISEIYSFENNRLRFLIDTYKGANVYSTEMHDNGKELPITVVESYDDKIQYISSIGDIVRVESDIKEQSFVIDPKVLRLLYKLSNNKEKSSKKDL